MTRILAVGADEYIGHGLPVEVKALGPGYHVETHHFDGNRDALRQAVRDVDAVLTDYVPFDADIIAGMKRCRVISVAATGYDCIDVAKAADAGINVCAVREYCTDEVADHTLLLILALARKLVPWNDDVQRSLRWQYGSRDGLLRLSGLNLGIVGFGRIGQAVALRARAFGLSVLVYDPLLAENTDDDVTSVAFETVLRESDILTLHCSLNEHTREMLGYSEFSAMRRCPIFINVARGGLVVQNDLVRALDEGLISAAGLDVLDSESPELSGSPLIGRDNVVMTPHIAFYSDAAMEQCRRVSAANIRYCLEGRDVLVDHYIQSAGVQRDSH